jgi:hypothetical protein
MTILLVLAYATFTAVMLIQTARMFLSGREQTPGAALLSDELRQLEELVALRAQLLSSLRELELDRELEKISDEDYQLLKRRYERQAVQIMRRLDALYGGQGWEEKISMDIDALDGGLTLVSDAKASRGSLERVEQGAPQPGALALAGWTCHSCRREMTGEDTFCGSCGAKIAADDQAAAHAIEAAMTGADQPCAHEALTEQAAPRELTGPANP